MDPRNKLGTGCMNLIEFILACITYPFLWLYSAVVWLAGKIWGPK